MPELPEVQTTVDGLNRFVKNLKIVEVFNFYQSVFHVGKDNVKDESFFKKFKKEVAGKKILFAERRGKNILVHLSGKLVILIHMKMTGHLLYGDYILEKGSFHPKDKNSPLAESRNGYIRFAFLLSNKKHLVLSDLRRFAKITLLKEEEIADSPHLKDLGPEPLENSFSPSLFEKQILKRKNTPIKTVLMDPKVIAGVGNIYSDEALLRAEIHPERKPVTLSKKEISALHKSVIAVLQKGIGLGGDSMSDYRNIEGHPGEFSGSHEAYRRTGLPCKKKGCKGKIVRKKVLGRSAHFCDTHQK